MSTRESRRNFLKTTATAGGGLIIGLNFLESCVSKVVKAPVNTTPLATLRNGFEAVEAHPITDFIQIGPDGNIFVCLTKNEMGQGVSTGLSAILAEELEADWSKINIQYVGPIEGVSNSTGGSTSALSQWDLLRKAGAFAKYLLISAAAKEWSVTKDACYAENNHVHLHGSDVRLEYGEVVAQVVVPDDYRTLFEKVPLKYRSKFRLIGKSLKSKIIPDIITGQHPYSIDVQLPGMKYAAVLRCPVYGGKLLTFDASEALKITGVEKVVQIDGVILDTASHIRDGIAVIADSTWAAFQGKQAIQAEWDLGEKAEIAHETFVADSHEQLNSAKGIEILRIGRKVKNNEIDKIISRTYEFPYQHHACTQTTALGLPLRLPGRFLDWPPLPVPWSTPHQFEFGYQREMLPRTVNRY